MKYIYICICKTLWLCNPGCLRRGAMKNDGMWPRHDTSLQSALGQVAGGECQQGRSESEWKERNETAPIHAGTGLAHRSLIPFSWGRNDPEARRVKSCAFVPPTAKRTEPIFLSCPLQVTAQHNQVPRCVCRDELTGQTHCRPVCSGHPPIAVALSFCNGNSSPLVNQHILFPGAEESSSLAATMPLDIKGTRYTHTHTRALKPPEDFTFITKIWSRGKKASDWAHGISPKAWQHQPH